MYETIILSILAYFKIDFPKDVKDKDNWILVIALIVLVFCAVTITWVLVSSYWLTLQK